MKVVVETGKSWDAPDSVKVGDEVLVPPAANGWADLFPGGWQRVTQLGSDYQGPLRSVLELRPAQRPKR